MTKQSKTHHVGKNDERVGKWKVTRYDGAKINDGVPSSIVVTFGWLGAHDKNLRKYADLAHACGAAEVWRSTAPFFDAFMISPKLADIATGLLGELQNKRPGVPVVLMYFSNGGGYVHQYLSKILETDRQKYKDVNIVGVVFDSAPAWATWDTAALAVSSGMRSKFGKLIAMVFVTLFMWLIHASVKKGRQHYFDTIEHDHISCPQLFIYSTSDMITLPDKLQSLIEARRRSHPAGPASVHEWRITKPSPHVSHLIKHPQEYKDKVQTFFKLVLGGSLKQPSGGNLQSFGSSVSLDSDSRTPTTAR